MVGEIRDLETAEIAFRAAMTGHLVISTLHTNGAVETMTRLIDIGIPKYLVSSSMIGVVAQRLVRKICESCKSETLPSKNRRENPSDPEDTKRRPRVFEEKGCDKCNMTGFHGRFGIFEVLPFTSKIKDLISSGAKEEDIRTLAEKEGFKNMGADGVIKVYQGITTLNEVLRVINVEQQLQVLCPRCQETVELDFIVCPNCSCELQPACASCYRKIKPKWRTCPYCRTPLIKKNQKSDD
jgi:type II secretory ATPase GspE/PulE/Tfp pilus assembly ATPase PilB-like protein